MIVFTFENLATILAIVLTTGSITIILSRGLRRLERRIDAMDTKFERKFEALDAKLERKIGALDAKYESKSDASESRFDRLERELAALRTDMVAGFGEVNASIARLEERTSLWEQVVVPLVTGRATPAVPTPAVNP